MKPTLDNLESVADSYMYLQLSDDEIGSSNSSLDLESRDRRELKR